MQTPLKDKTSKPAKIVLVVGILLIIAVSLTLLFWDSSPPPSRPKPIPAPAVPIVKSEAETTSAKTPATPTAATENSPNIYLTSTETLKQLTELQSALEVQKLLVALEEQNAKLKKLQEEPAPEALPQIVALPPAAPALLEAQAPPPAGQARVISIQGLDGNVAATVETALGLRILKVGDRYGEGRVERISALGVQIREGENTHIISVEE